VKPPERPGSLTGIDLDTIQVGGWWVGAPAANGPPWLPKGREIWLSSAADPVTGIAWQMATTQAVAGAESQVWLRQRVGGSWTAWRWQSGGLPEPVSVDFTLPIGTAMGGHKWHPSATARIWSPVPIRARITFHVAYASVASNAQGNHTIYVGAHWGFPDAFLSFMANKPHDAGHTTFSMTFAAGTTSLTVWTNGTGGSSFTGSEPQGALRILPIAVLSDVAGQLETEHVPLPDSPEIVPHNGIPPLDPTLGGP
jgi:hypothetical protein